MDERRAWHVTASLQLCLDRGLVVVLNTIIQVGIDGLHLAGIGVRRANRQLVSDYITRGCLFGHTLSLHLLIR